MSETRDTSDTRDTRDTSDTSDTSDKAEAPGGGDPSSSLKEKKSDDSWKHKAQQEKEKLAGEEEAPAHRYPPASFLGLVEELSLRAMLALGQLPNPVTGEVIFDPEAAKYTIDLLGVLEARTQGKLEPAEARGLQEVLHNLRLAYVYVSRNPPSAAVEPDAEDTPLSDRRGPPPSRRDLEDEGPSSAAGPRIIL